MKKALVIGSLNIDMTTKVENLPRLGETIFGNNFYESCGGKGANQAVAISKLGMETEMIGMIGNDSHGKKLIENLKKYNVKHDNIIRSPEPTGHALILVDKNGNNSIIVISGANFKITERHIDEKTDIINENDIIILQNEIPLNVVEHALKKAGFTDEDLAKPWTMYRPVGCDACRGKGFKGRAGVYEVMPITAEMQRVIMEGGNEVDIQQMAYREGMVDLRRAGLLKVMSGITSLEEVLGNTND